MLSATIVTVMAAVPSAGAGALSPACTILLNSPPLLSARRDRSQMEIREACRGALRRANSHRNPDPLEVTPELLLLHWELSHPKSLPAYERRQMLRALKVRLEFQWKRLERIRKLGEKTARRSARAAVTRGNARPQIASSAGGGVAGQAAALIELIRNTIEPDSWDVNGGRGRISFYGDPFYVLVIRNTAEVHNQIGGALRP